ncbi:MAG: hypothetical protein JJE13_13115 [Thermoleophilia bacterium]|nr:hypothetical protein [Thermoleophilia bacterium]
MKYLAASLTALSMLFGATSANAGSGQLDSYCSPTSDFCQELVRDDGRVKAQLSTFSFRGKIQLCVQDPPATGHRFCEKFRLRSKAHGIYLSRVTLSRHFDFEFPGRYSVSWRFAGTKIGKTLHFRRR